VTEDWSRSRLQKRAPNTYSIAAGQWHFDEHQAKTLTDAFEEALRLADVEDSTSLHAEALARRVIAAFKVGEKDPGDLSRLAAAN
jgi:hypothetical protein